MGKRIVPEAVAKRALASGEECRHWLEGIDSLVAGLERDWRIRVGEAFTGGTDAFVAPAEAADGARCVLRLSMPDETARHDMLQADSALLVAGGRGYARVLREDPERLACLMERLGRPLSGLGLPVERQLELLCETLRRTWFPVPDEGRAALLSRGAEAVAWFRGYIPAVWERLGRPLPRALVDGALGHLDACAARLGTFAPVLVHGDANASNLLEDPLAPGSFRFIDPDGALYEPACDLGVLMIAAPETLRADPLRQGLARCERLHGLTGVDPAQIWQWGCVQSVSTALVCLEIEHPSAPAIAALAAAWAVPNPFG